MSKYITNKFLILFELLIIFLVNITFVYNHIFIYLCMRLNINSFFIFNRIQMFMQSFLRSLIKPYLLQLIMVVGDFVLLLQLLLPVILLVKQIFLYNSNNKIIKSILQPIV